MPHEITDWKESGCSLSLATSGLSSREIFSREINEIQGEGGALNACYRTAEAIAAAANILGAEKGLIYGKDFVFKTRGIRHISFDFRDKSTKELAKKVLGAFLN